MMYTSETAYQSKEINLAMQEHKLQELVIYLEKYSPFYKELFAKNHILAADIKTLKDLQKIPVTRSEEHTSELQSQ